MSKLVTLTAELSDQQAQALAQLVKRIGWSEIRMNAVDDDDAYLMQEAISALRDGLAADGYAPR